MNGFKSKRLLKKQKMLIQLKSVMPGSRNISLVQHCVYLISVCSTNQQTKQIKNKKQFHVCIQSLLYIMGFITSDFAIIECDVKALSCFCLCEPKKEINSINKICQIWNIFLLESARGASEMKKKK